MRARLGMIGGAGPYASALLYQSILDELYKEGKPILEMFILNYPFTHPHACKDLDEWDKQLEKELQTCVETLTSAGIATAVIVCNTLHAYLDRVKGNIRFIHLPKTVIQNVISKKASKLLVLCTEITKREGLYSSSHYNSVFPNILEQQKVDGIIENILDGQILEEDAILLEQLIQDIQKRESCDGVVLGCTELPVLHARYPLKTACILFDSIKIIARALTKEEI